MADRGNRPVSLQEVADASGVSITTASFALSGPPPGRRPPAAATVARIQQVADQLGYAPNRSARAMRTGRVETVVLALGAIHDDWESELTGLVRDRALPAGLSTMVLVDESWYQALQGNTSVSALITGGPFSDTQLRQLNNLAAQGVRLVAHGVDVQELAVDQVVSSPFEATAQAYRLLRSRHDRVGFVGMRDVQPSDRLTSYRQAALDQDDPDSAASGFNGGLTVPMTMERALAWLGSDQVCSALVAHNGTVASAVWLAAFRLGIRVPEDLEIIALGDVAPDSAAIGAISCFAPVNGLERLAEITMRRAQTPVTADPVVDVLDWVYQPGVTTVNLQA